MQALKYTQIFKNSLDKETSIIILKIASRCNLKCTYCHWFRDPDVYKQPPLMSKGVFDHFINRLNDYFYSYAKNSFKVVFHGGEPTLLKKELFEYMCIQLRLLEKKHDKVINLGITTNGTFIDDDWMKLWKKYNVGVSVSIDGDAEAHNRYRVDFKGKGTYSLVSQGIKKLHQAGIKCGTLAVCQPDQDPEKICQHLVDELGLKRFNILIPNFNNDDKEKGLVVSIADYYIKLFNLWIEKYWQQGIRIRNLEAFVKAVLHQPTSTPSIGFTPMKVISITPAGSIQPHDVLRIAGSSQVELGLFLQRDPLSSIFETDAWQSTLNASVTLPDACLPCKYKDICCGGNVIHRYSSKNGYNNPSVYCDDLQRIYQHIMNKLPYLQEIGMIKKLDY